MKKYNNFIWFIVFVVFLIIVLSMVFNFSKNDKTVDLKEKTKGIMVLIEYKDTVGLTNFVNEMQKRNIYGLLQVNKDFVESNCETIKKLTDYNVEIVASSNNGPFWDVPFEKQKADITEMKAKIEECTGKPIRMISSRYMASDLNTLKAAEELNIPYIVARGTTDSKATVYTVEGYNTKVLSISNIPKIQYKYGSLCDYSYYERSGTPDDMKAEIMRAIQPLTKKEKERYGAYQRVTPVSHTNIGGYLKPWMDMWINVWDTTKDSVEWVDLDTFMKDSDWTVPSWQLPINKNAPYTPEKIRPITPYDEVEKVSNPCRVDLLPYASE